MLRALVESAGRFDNLPPVGYEETEIRWVIDLGNKPEDARLIGLERGELRKFVPIRGDRSGKVSEDNLKPALLVDRAKYALGVGDDGIDPERPECKGFRDLVSRAAVATGDEQARKTRDFLETFWATCGEGLKAEVRHSVKKTHLVAYRSGTGLFPFEERTVQGFWKEYLSTEYVLEGSAHCAVCRGQGRVLRILPWQITLFGKYSAPISSFNEPAFNSFGKEQTANSPLCFECGAKASTVLQHLVNSQRHTRVLSRDERRGGGGAPLRNQLAVFWLKETPIVEQLDGGKPVDFEAAFAEPLGEVESKSGPPPDPVQVKALLGLPWSPGESGLNLARNRFYLAVLSPNKSRLVVRDWFDMSVSDMCERLETYAMARAVVTADGSGVVRPTIAEVISSLRPWKGKSAGSEVSLMRALVRTAYLGTPPPAGLLEAAVRRFRVPVRARPGEELDLNRWREGQAAAIKIVLTYGTEEADKLWTLDSASRSRPYRCGQLLAILEEAQLRASRWRVNARLVDRFYGGASSAPATTLGLLLNRATQQHLPKIRKARLGYGEIEALIEEATTVLDESGGFPRTLTLREQGEFALGFYHQRAHFQAARPKGKGQAQENRNEGEAENE